MSHQYTPDTRAVAERLVSLLQTAGYRVTRNEQHGASHTSDYGTSFRPDRYRLYVPSGRSHEDVALCAVEVPVYVPGQAFLREQLQSSVTRLLADAGFVVRPATVGHGRGWVLPVLQATTPELHARDAELRPLEREYARRTALASGQHTVAQALCLVAGAEAAEETAALAALAVSAYRLTIGHVTGLLHHDDRAVRVAALRLLPLFRSLLAGAHPEPWAHRLAAAVDPVPHELAGALRAVWGQLSALERAAVLVAHDDTPGPARELRHVLHHVLPDTVDRMRQAAARLAPDDPACSDIDLAAPGIGRELYGPGPSGLTAASVAARWTSRSLFLAYVFSRLPDAELLDALERSAPGGSSDVVQAILDRLRPAYADVGARVAEVLRRVVCSVGLGRPLETALAGPEPARVAPSRGGP